MIRSTGKAGGCGRVLSAGSKPLYNGNISAMSVNIGKLNNPLLYNYQYDQLNRLVAMDAFSGLDTSNNTWHTLTTDNSYQERVSYDANGNIQKYLRNGTVAGGTPLGMDSLTYKYNRNANGQLTNNQLSSVNDSVPAGNYPNDIDNQSANNYGYDAIGNMTSDVAGGISIITWTVYGKISSITKTDGSTVAYTYDAAGNRISKTVAPASGVATTTWYVRDASGNTMAVYTANGTDSLHQTEQDLYGSSRLGIYNRNINADALLPAGNNTNFIGNYIVSYFTRGNKNYELNNHLGNVLATVSDKKFGVDANGDGIIDYFYSDVVSANDYYPFGMMMPGRKYSIANTNYRYGFNGKENDNEVKGEGNQQDYGMRIYDPRLVRFLSVDPVANKYPELTPYQFASNRPIDGIDRDGLEFYQANNGKIYFSQIDYLTGKSAVDVKTQAIVSTNMAMLSKKLIPPPQQPKTPIRTPTTDHPEDHAALNSASRYFEFNDPKNVQLRFNTEQIKKSKEVTVSQINPEIPFKPISKDEVANGLRTTSNALNITGKIFQGAGVLISVTTGQVEIGGPLLVWGKTMSIGSDASDIGADVVQGNNKNVAIKVAVTLGSEAVGGGVAKQLTKGVTNEVTKQTTDYMVGQTVNKAGELIKDKTAPEKKE